MTTEQTANPTGSVYEAKPVVSKRRRVFARTFGIPGFIFAIISMWFTVAQSLMAMTASGITEILAQKLLHMSFAQIMNAPLLALCCISVMWATFSIALCALSRFLGTSIKINQAGFVLSVVSIICSVSLSCFSIVYMILA
ncbi:MAG: hypothetical protein Q4B92_03425 [Ruminococcus sp.]|nr:hypothetical protein [Ruminococcus sp.]